MVGQLGLPYVDLDGCVLGHGLCVTSSHPMVETISNVASKTFPLSYAVFGHGVADTWANGHGECSNGVGVVAVTVARADVCPLVMGTAMAIAMHA